MVATSTYTRSSTSTCTSSRVEAVLDLFCGDLVAFIARDLLTETRAKGWLRDLRDVLVLEAVEHFQVKITFPNGTKRGLDYQVSDDGRIRATDASGGFSAAFIPVGSKLRLSIGWRARAPKLERARRLLRGRGWGPSSSPMLDVSGPPDRAFSDGGYGVHRRFAGGAWE